MAIRTNITIFDSDGHEADRIVTDYVAETYDQQNSQRRTVTGSTTKFEVDFGPVTTAKYIYAETDQDISVYLSNSLVCIEASDVFLVIGCSETAMHILAENDTNLFIYVAGD